MAHDDIPYQSEESDDVYKFVKDRGQFIATQRTAGISTSDLITRIVCDYDQYVRRNLKRGASPRDLNLSLLKQGEIKMEQLTDKLQERLKQEERNVKNNWESSREELRTMLEQWEMKSQELIRDFSNLFDVRRIISQLRNRSRKRSKAAIHDAILSVTDDTEAATDSDPPSLKKKLIAAFNFTKK